MNCAGGLDGMKTLAWRWPGEKPIAVLFNICLEAWSDGVAPGISPMGNPLPPGVLDTMAISWASYGAKCGIYRLLDALDAYGAKASVMTNAIIAERAPEAIKACAAGGHEILSHSYAMDVIPALLSIEEQRRNIARCTSLLADVSGNPVKGWLSPRGTSGPEHPRLLADAGYRWHGDAFDSDLPYVQDFGASKLVAIPLGTDVNDMPFMKYGNPPELMRRSFDENLALGRDDRSGPVMIDVTVHAHIFGRPRGAYIFGEIVREATGSPDVWVATRLEVAEFVLRGQRSSA
jgi:hypothetical protein